MKKKTVIFAALSIFGLALVLVACSAIRIPTPIEKNWPTEPPTVIIYENWPTEPPTVSVEMEIQSAQTEAAQNNGYLTLAISGSQIELILESKLDTLPDPYMRNPQVDLRDGKIKITGYLNSKYTDQANDNDMIVLAANIDTEGKPVVTSISAKSESPLHKTISAFFAEAISSALHSATYKYYLEDVTFSDGSIIFKGQAKYIGNPEPNWCATPTNNNVTICFTPTPEGLIQEIRAAQTSAAPNGVLMLTIREDQIISWLTSIQDHQTNTFLYHKVRLSDRKDGIIHVSVDVRRDPQENVWKPIRVDLLPTINAEGRPVIIIANDDSTGPITDELEKTIRSSVAKDFTDLFDRATTGFRLENITITYGVITLTGKAK